MFLQPTSIRGRFILLVAGIVILLLGIAVYTDWAATDTERRNARLSAEQRELIWALSGLSDALHRTGIAVYQVSFFSEQKSSVLLQERLDKLRSKVADLLSLPAIKVNEGFLEPAISLEKNLSHLIVQIHNLLQVQSDVETRYPGMPIMLNKMQPTNARFMAAVVEALEEAKQGLQDPSQREIYSTLRDLRYLWAQLISSVRVFVANRLGAFGPPEKTMAATENDSELYYDSVKDLLNKLEKAKSAGQLRLVQTDALQRMQVLSREYEKYFQQVARIYYSDNWRADQVILREGIDPLMEKTWTQIFRLQALINHISETEMYRSAAITDTLSNYIWLVMGLICSLLVFGYLAFEHIIRKPIQQVAKALEAEGRGESSSSDISVHVSETYMLVNAFSKMREQVRSRQLRLQTILDNTGEGIFTFREDGTLESFNIAAQQLFGYQESDVIGQDFSMLIDHPRSKKTKQSVLHELTQDLRAARVEGEYELIGRRKDGSVFVMSLRLSLIHIDGEVLYTTLVSDISERKAMLDRLTQLAERDSLTGLYNRHFLMDELERIVERAVRNEEHQVALLYIDLDNFKYVNDTLGHLAGDKVLQEVTVLLQNRARGTDLISRLGGDEFAVILYDATRIQAKVVANAYRRQIADYRFKDGSHIVDIGCSIGVALFQPDIANKEDLLSRADLACHMAKRGGKNRVYVYNKEDQLSLETMSTDMGWVHRIKDSIEFDRFMMACQPIMQLATERISGYEVLIRLPDDDNGHELISPSGFLPSADRFGLIVEIDRWMIRNAIKTFANHEGLTFSINLSPKSIGDIGILQLIQAESKTLGIEPQNIIFEVTESGAIANINGAIEFLTQVRQLGFKTALDDFGVGYCSFSYLKDLPVDYVKIDGSFVQNLVGDTVKQAIVKSMNEVAHSLGKQTVAEFVEDRDTLEYLRTIGVDFCQGYYIGEPKVEAIETRHASVV